MDNDTWNVGKLPRIGDQLIVPVEKAAIDEEMAFDPSEGERKVICRKIADALFIMQQR